MLKPRVYIYLLSSDEMWTEVTNVQIRLSHVLLFQILPRVAEINYNLLTKHSIFTPFISTRL